MLVMFLILGVVLLGQVEGGRITVYSNAVGCTDPTKIIRQEYSYFKSQAFLQPIADATCVVTPNVTPPQSSKLYCESASSVSSWVSRRYVGGNDCPEPALADLIGTDSLDCVEITSTSFVQINCAEESSSTCFPSAARVELKNGSHVAMSELQVGDEVLSTWGLFSPVYFFSHREVDAVNPFVEIFTEDKRMLRLTAGHYMYVNGALKLASAVRVGDVIDAPVGRSTVTKVETVLDTGLINPHTMHGDIVVNGVRTSTYTDALNPVLAHSLLAPLRALYTLNDGHLPAADASASMPIY